MLRYLPPIALIAGALALYEPLVDWWGFIPGYFTCLAAYVVGCCWLLILLRGWASTPGQRLLRIALRLLICLPPVAFAISGIVEATTTPNDLALEVSFLYGFWPGAPIWITAAVTAWRGRTKSQVAAGQVVGTSGSTGNGAQSTPLS